MIEVKGVTAGWRSQWTVDTVWVPPLSAVKVPGSALQCRTVQWTPVVVARQVIGRYEVLGILY